MMGAVLGAGEGRKVCGKCAGEGGFGGGRAVESGREVGGRERFWVQKAGIWNVFRKKLP